MVDDSGVMPPACGALDALGAFVADQLGDLLGVLAADALFDGAGDPVLDAMIEFWQTDATGRYGANGSAGGWARRAVDPETGSYRLETIPPAATQDAAAHVKVWAVARGINLGLHTRIYFADEDNSADPVLALIEPSRRQTLIASQQGGAYVFNVRLQGENETVFFDL